MATRTTVELIDDFDGSEATQTIPFSVNGASYMIDLNDKHAKQFRTTIEPFIGKARKAAPAPRRGAAPRNLRNPNLPARSRRAFLADVRVWAKRHGHKVSDRGRVPDDVMAKYEQAHRD